MIWQKLGLVWNPSVLNLIATTHASLPIPVVLEDRVRVIHSCRDREGHSFGSWFDFRPHRPQQILASADTPSLVPGSSGYFDDAGAMPSTAWWHGELLHLLYVGWNLSVSVPFRNAIGLATSSDDGKTFEKYSDGPVIDRSVSDPAFAAAPFVLPGPRLRLWYASCLEWVETASGLQHRYHLKYAESDDGISWERDGLVALDFNHPREYAISRPSVIHDGEVLRMWFPSRGDAYRIRYAESSDGLVWDRHDGIALDVSESGWDSDMTAYPAVFDWNGERYMLYNGNGFGSTGIGLAVLEAD